MGATLGGGGPRKEHSSNVMRLIAEATLGNGLIEAIIAKQRCIEWGMIMEAGVFENSIQRIRTEISTIGLNPDEVVEERIRLLTEAQNKTK